MRCENCAVHLHGGNRSAAGWLCDACCAAILAARAEGSNPGSVTLDDWESWTTEERRLARRMGVWIRTERTYGGLREG